MQIPQPLYLPECGEVVEEVSAVADIDGVGRGLDGQDPVFVGRYNLRRGPPLLDFGSRNSGHVLPYGEYNLGNLVVGAGDVPCGV